MNKAAIEKRLEELRDFHKQRLAEVNAIEGAIQDCLHWLSEVDKKEEVNNG